MMREDGSVRFYALVGHWREHNASLYVVDETQLVDGKVVKLSGASAVYLDEHEKTQRIPIGAGTCLVDDSLFLVGGTQPIMGSKERVSSKSLLSVPLPRHGDGDRGIRNGCWTWKKSRGAMEHARSYPTVFPHDGKIYILGGKSTRGSWVEIYDLNEGKFLPGGDAPPPQLVDYAEETPSSCFFWDSMGRVIVCFGYGDGRPSRLLSYDAEKNHWDSFDPSFPACPFNAKFTGRNLIPYGNTLFIIDYAKVWSVYDLSERKVVEHIEVDVSEYCEDRHVLDAFCQPRSRGILIFTIFMEGDEDDSRCVAHGIPYAQVLVKPTMDERFVAVVGKEGILDVDDYRICSIFAQQIDDSSAEESPPGVNMEKKKKKKKKKNKKLLEAVE